MIMKKKLQFSFFLVLTVFFSTKAQVGVGTASPHASSALHVEDANRGVVIPRVSLVNISNGTTPVNAPLTSLLVYNTNAAVVGGNGVGFYFWNGSIWEKINSGNTPDHDWYEVGTTTAPNSIADNIFTTNNVGINVPNPGTYQLLVGDDDLPAIHLGANEFNIAESGRFVFGESVSTYINAGNYCGFEFRNDGVLNSLFLTGACTAPNTIATFERTGNVGIATNDPSELLEIGGTNAELFMNSNSSNTVRFNGNGLATPSFTTRSLGTKLVLNPTLNTTNSDFALGVDSNSLWNSIPQAISTYSHRWYSGITEQMRFRGDGRLGIGTIAPTATRLQAYDPAVTTSRIAIFRNGNVDGTEVQVGSVEYLHDYSSTTDFNDGVNSVGLTINFNATSGYDLQLVNNSAAKPTSGSWTIVSDKRLKEDVNPFTDGLNVLKNINPVYFKYNGKAKTPSNEYGIGVLAQDVKEIAPYMVGEFEYLPDENDKASIEHYLSYNPDALHYITVNAIKELDEEITKLKSLTTNLSDFGSKRLDSHYTEILFNDSFAEFLDDSSLPIVTITPLNTNVSVSIVEVTNKGFKIKIENGASFENLQVNWIAMTKAKQDKVNKLVSNASDRLEMIQKVKLPKTRLKERIQREQDELVKFKDELRSAEQKEKLEQLNLSSQASKQSTLTKIKDDDE